MTSFNAPDMDYAALSPIIALTAGLCVVLLAGVFDLVKRAVPVLTLLVLCSRTWGAPPPAGESRWQWPRFEWTD